MTGPATDAELAGVDRWLDRVLKLEPPCDLVLDTNALLAVASLHDVSNAIEKTSEPSWEAAALANEDVRYLLQRAQDTLLLGWVMHERKTRTFLLGHEAMTLLPKRVPPEEGKFEDLYTTIFVHFTLDLVLSGWTLINDTEDLDKGISGDSRDDLAVAVAVANRIPLITFEGNSKTGSYERDYSGKLKIRGKATGRGADVYTPGEYLDHLGIDRDAAREAFRQRFDELAPGWLADLTGLAKENLKEVGLYLALVLSRRWWPELRPRGSLNH